MGTGSKGGWSLEKCVGGNHENRGRAPREMGEESSSNGVGERGMEPGEMGVGNGTGILGDGNREK